MAWITPRHPPSGDSVAAWRIHEGTLDIPASQMSIEAPRLCVLFEYPEIDTIIGVPGTDFLCGCGHQQTADTVPFEFGKNMEIVNQGAPRGVVMAVQEDEPDRLRLYLGDKPEVGRRQIA